MHPQGLGAGVEPWLRPAGPSTRSPLARTHSAWVKALSPSGTAVNPFPEQSTRRSPSQLQGAAQRGGAAPLGPAEPSSPRAKKQSSRSGPGIAAAAARLSRRSPRSARLRCPPPPRGAPGAAGLRGSGPGRRPSAVRVRSLPSAVRRQSVRTRRSAVSPFPLLHGRAPAAPRLSGSGQPTRPRAAARAARCHRCRLLSRASSSRTAPQGCGAQPPAMPARRPNPRPGSHKHPGCPRSPRGGSRSARPFPF